MPIAQLADENWKHPIKEYLQLGLSLSLIRMILNPQLEQPLSYPSYQYFVRQDLELLELWQLQMGSN